LAVREISAGLVVICHLLVLARKQGLPLVGL
jgi:hypothetical protein